MLNFYNYMVGFVDLLGQRNEYRGEGLLPEFISAEDKKRFTERIKRTIGAIHTLQQDADKFLKAARGYKSKLRDSLPPDKQFIWDEMKKAMRGVLEANTLQDLANRQKSKDGNPATMYYI